MKEYNWKHWISDPMNRKLYDENPQQALREYNTELGRRANLMEFQQANSMRFSAVVGPRGNGSGTPGAGEPSLGYGLLYNFYAATDVRGVAPSGFRVPSQSDFNTLIENATPTGLKSDRGIADGDPYWNTPGDNSLSTGLQAAGIRSASNGNYSNLRASFFGWSTSEATASSGRYFLVSSVLSVNTTLNRIGASIRCVSDTEPSTTLVQDNDGNNYSWVQIGSQYWLQQSLKTTTYNNGDAIATGLDNTAWSNTTDGAWAYPNGDDTLPI